MTKADEIAALARGDGCLGRSKDDEPVFILVARDVFSSALVREWADRVESNRARAGTLDAAAKAKIAEARRMALAMEDWRAANGGGKVPD